MPAKTRKTEPDLPKLAAPAMRALAGAGLISLAELSRAGEAEVMALHGMGPNAMKTIKAAMKAKGLSFAKR
jgi:predicted Fe-Mo cluster-binding NifX family protein